MSWNDHDHRGEYADERHDHHLDYAERHHRHYDDESVARGLREDLSAAEERIRQLEEQYAALIGKLWATGNVPDERTAFASWRPIHRRPGSCNSRRTSPRPTSPSPATTVTGATAAARTARRRRR